MFKFFKSKKKKPLDIVELSELQGIAAGLGSGFTLSQIILDLLIKISAPVNCPWWHVFNRPQSFALTNKYVAALLLERAGKLRDQGNIQTDIIQQLGLFAQADNIESVGQIYYDRSLKEKTKNK